MDTSLLVVRLAFRSHIDADVVEVRCLGDLPVYASHEQRSFCHVDDKVSQLPEEVVLVGIPRITCRIRDINVSVEYSQANAVLIIRGDLDCWRIDCVSYHLSGIPHDQRPADLVCARRDIHERRCDGRRLAVAPAGGITTTTSVAGVLDRVVDTLGRILIAGGCIRCVS